MNESEYIDLEKDSWKLLPNKCGVYIFKSKASEEDKKTKVLYVGKAKKLRSRVGSYFSGETDQRAFAKFIKERTDIIEYILTANEHDALILENQLIKRFRPTYNIHLKDDKRYLSLRIDQNHEWPRVELTRKIRKDGALYLGPYSSSLKVRETLNVMQKIFPLRTCPDRKLYNRSRPCIEYDIKRCVAPCVGYVEQEKYKELVHNAILFLKGENSELLSDLERKMRDAAVNENYEEAARYRDQVQAVRDIGELQPSVVGESQRQRGADLDVMGMARTKNMSVISVLFVRDGMVWDQKNYEFRANSLDDEELLQQFLSQFYSSNMYEPHEIVLPIKLEDFDFGIRSKILKPRSQEKQRYLQMAVDNAQSHLEVRQKKSEQISELLESIQKKLRLKALPVRIDCIDVSHHQGDEIVASVVRFKNALPEKEFYRKLILEVEDNDDFQSIREVVGRRYKSDEDLPDLLIIDGGRGQLSAAETALKEKTYWGKLDVVSLAKARPDEELIDPLNPKNRERIFLPGRKNPILLQEGSPEELLLSYLRDEAHRFAIDFHRLRKLKSISISELDEIEGISSRLKLKLLKEFGSVEAIESSEDAQLLKFLNAKQLEALREKFNRHSFLGHRD